MGVLELGAGLLLSSKPAHAQPTEHVDAYHGVDLTAERDLNVAQIEATNEVISRPGPVSG